jgi:hypothetical protein
MPNEQNAEHPLPPTDPDNNPDKYLVYPEDDGTDRPRNPYSTV